MYILADCIWAFIVCYNALWTSGFMDFLKIFLFSVEEQIPPAGSLLTGTFSVFSLKHFNSTALDINLLIYLRVSAQLNTIFYACSERWGRSRTMLSCTADVYILLLDSGLHLLHAPFRPKKKHCTIFYCQPWKEKHINEGSREPFRISFTVRSVGGENRGYGFQLHLSRWSVVFEMRTTDLWFVLTRRGSHPLITLWVNRNICIVRSIVFWCPIGFAIKDEFTQKKKPHSFSKLSEWGKK